MARRRNRALIRRHGGRMMPFRDLPAEAQLAIAHYMAIDGEAWELPWEPRLPFRISELRRMLPELVKRYGAERFGYVEIPTAELVESVTQDEEYREAKWDDFELYHAWYKRNAGIPRHPKTNRWPVILSSFEDETLQDGWHRFHRYYQQGARKIPAVYWP